MGSRDGFALASFPLRPRPSAVTTTQPGESGVERGGSHADRLPWAGSGRTGFPKRSVEAVGIVGKTRLDLKEG